MRIKVQNKKGIALILALFSMLFISLLVVAFLDTATIEQQILTNYVRTTQATFIADAGVEQAIYELRQDSGYSGTGGDVEFPSGTGNTYNVVVSGGDTITSTGTVMGFERSIEATYSSMGALAPYQVIIDTWKDYR